MAKIFRCLVRTVAAYPRRLEDRPARSPIGHEVTTGDRWTDAFRFVSSGSVHHIVDVRPTSLLRISNTGLPMDVTLRV